MAAVRDGAPTRYYLPKADVHLELLRPSDKLTACPYKGRASYYSVVVGDRVVPDVAWTYTFPIPEQPKIAGLIAFLTSASTSGWTAWPGRPVSAWSMWPVSGSWARGPGAARSARTAERAVPYRPGVQTRAARFSTRRRC